MNQPESHSQIIAAKFLEAFNKVGIDKCRKKYENGSGQYPCTIFKINTACSSMPTYQYGNGCQSCAFYSVVEEGGFDAMLRLVNDLTKKFIPLEEIEIPSIGIKGKWRLA